MNAQAIQIGIRIGPYEVLGRLGEGGMGQDREIRRRRIAIFTAPYFAEPARGPEPWCRVSIATR